MLGGPEVTPPGMRRLSPEAQRERADSAERAGWGKLYRGNPFITRTSVKGRRRQEHQEQKEAEGRCVRVGTFEQAYTGQSVESRDGPKYCLSRSQWNVLQPGERLGCGSFGCGYARADGKVVKVTWDGSDIAALQAMQGHRRVVKLYAAYKLPSQFPTLKPPSSPAYAGIVERVRPVRFLDDSSLDNFAIRARRAKEILRESYEGSATKGPRYRVSQRYRDDFMSKTCPLVGATREELRDCRRFAGDVIRVHEHLGRRGFNFFDVHPGNIGVDAEGDWKFLDVGYSSDTKLPRVSKLNGR